MLNKLMSQLFSINGIVLISLLTYVANTAKSWVKSLWNFIMLRFEMNLQTQTITIKYHILSYFKNLHNNDPNFVFNRNIKVSYYNFIKRIKLTSAPVAASYKEFSIPYGAFLIRVDTFCWCLISHYANNNVHTDSRDSEYTSFVNVTFYGFGRRKIYDDLLEYIEKKINDVNVIEYFMHRHETKLIAKEDYRTKIFGKANQVHTLVSKFIDSKDFYERFNRPHKFNLLLYGEPGTGKTSIIKDIIYKNNITQVVDLNVLADYPNLAEINGEYNSSNIILYILEDIDKLIYKDDGSMNNKLVHLLMQILDGLNSMSNSLLILTTNNIDMLPENLIRTGRIDYKLEIGKLNREEALEMVNYYECDESILDPNETEFNPSALENKIYDIKFKNQFKDIIK